MSNEIQIGIIGAGSVFTPELIQLILKKNLDVANIVLMDKDVKRLEILKGLAERQIKNVESSISVEATDSYKNAINGSDFILLQPRIGGQEMRMKDEEIARKYSIPYVETLTVPGLGAFLRTVPVYNEIADLIKEYSPNAKIMNFANPAGPLTAYLHKIGLTNAVGVCNIPVGNIARIAEAFNVAEDDVSMNWKGLNHFAVADRVIIKGNDVTTELINKLINGDIELPFSSQLLADINLLISPYYQYYFHSDERLEELLNNDKTRGQEVKGIEDELLSIYADPQTVEMPELLKERGGFKYSEVVANLIESFLIDNHRVHYINVPNNGTIPSLPDHVIVEVPTIVENGVLVTLNTGELPLIVKSFIHNMATVYNYWIDAVINKEPSSLRKALLLDPLFPDAQLSDQMLKDIFKANEDYIENFYTIKEEIY